MKTLIKNLKSYCNRTYRREKEREIFMEAVNMTIAEIDKKTKVNEVKADSGKAEQADKGEV